MGRDGVVRVAFAAAAAALAVAIAVPVYDIGLIQGRYDVGAPGWIEGSFGWLYLLFGGIVGLVGLGLAAFMGRGAGGFVRRRVRDLLVVAVAALWLGYGAGWATAALAGPGVERAGTLRFTLGPPIATTLETAARCISVVGDGGLLAELDPIDPDVPVVYLRHQVERNPYPTIVQLDEYRSFILPGAEPPSIGPFDWAVQALEEHPTAGRMVVTGTLWGSGTGPGSIAVEVTWTCGSEGG